MTILAIRLLGDFQLNYGDVPVTTINQGRLQSLLTYLLLHRHTPQPRQQIAFLLWPDSTEAQAQTNLRRELHHLRKLLPDGNLFLNVEQKTIHWRADAPIWLDVAEFGRLLERAAKSSEAESIIERIDTLEKAIQLYRGPLFPGCYEEWILPLREALEQRYVSALEEVAHLHEEQRAYPAAIRSAERLLRHDRLHETTYRQLMRLHVLNGDRAHALHIYHECHSILRQELGVEPSLETQTLFESLLRADAKAVSVQERQPSPHAEKQRALVGRTHEWQTLLTAWRTADRGDAQLTVISGEAGIGKTRLAEELLVWASRQGYLTARTRAYAMEGSLAYAPVTELLRNEELATHWSELPALWLQELVRLLPEVQESRPDLPPPQAITESWQRQRFFEALAKATLASNEPRVFLVDDIQWCDRETLEWLHYLMRFGARARLLLLCTVRSEEITVEHPLTSLRLELQQGGQLVEVELEALGIEDTRQLAVQTAGRPLSDSEAAQLFHDTEGNPLFVVETIRAVMVAKAQRWAAGEPNLQPPQQVDQPRPPKVYAIIQSRLGQLSPMARGLVQVAAAIGRSFTYPLLLHASDHSEEELVRILDELWKRRIILAQATNTYDFSHDRIREVTYASIGPASRIFIHNRIASALERVYEDDLDIVAAQLAMHYERGAKAEQAIALYQRAAEVAERVFATQEAVQHLTKALELLKSLPDHGAARRRELEIQISLGSALTTLKGWTDPAVKQTYVRALELGEQVGDIWQRFQAVWGMHSYYQVQAQFTQARALADELVQLAQDGQHPVLVPFAYFHLGTVLLQQGEFMKARANFEQTITLYDPRQRHSTLLHFRPDYGIFARCFVSHTLWQLGFPDQALAHGNQALALATELARPFDLVVALTYVATLRLFCRQIEPVQELAQAAVIRAEECGFPYYLAWATILLGWAQVERGNVVAGIAQIRRGLSDFDKAGARLRKPYYLGLLAEALGRAGEVEKGLSLLVEAFALISTTGEKWAETELFRVQGELWLAQGGAEVAEQHFKQALQLARLQQAKSPELRAAISLAQLWQEQARLSDARELLAPIISWFQEGMEMPDLMNAKALLDQLTSD